MAPGLSWAVPFVWLCVCVVHGRISVRPRIFDLQEQTIYRDRYNRMRGIEPVTLTVQGLHFVDSSKYSCLWSTPWEDRRSITSRIVDGKLLCTVNNTHPLAKWHLAGFWPLVNWGQEKTMGGVGRLTVVRAGANKKWYREYANVFETNIFFTRFSEMTRGEPPSVTAEKQRLANKFQDYIYHRQNPSDCQKASIVFLGHLEPTGMGSQLMMMSRHLFEVIHNESVLIPVFNWNYAEGLRPPVWQQIFKPLSRCETILLNKGVRPPGFHHPHISKFMTKAKFHDFQSGPPPDWDKVLPQEFTQFGYGWVYGQLLRYIMKPSDRMMKYVGLAHRQLQQDAGGRELMCVYIRQGERGTGSTSIPFGPYPMQRWHVADAYELLDMTAVPRHREAAWLVVSDTEYIKQGLIRELRRNGMTAFSSLDLNMTRAKGGQDCLREKHLIKCNADRDAVRYTVLVDLMVLTKCNHFFGTLSSTYARAALYHSYGMVYNKSVALSVE